MSTMTTADVAQKNIKEALEHFGIQIADLEGNSVTEIKNNKNTRKEYGIEGIMMGRLEKKVRIIIDYDTDFPTMLLRVFADGNQWEE